MRRNEEHMGHFRRVRKRILSADTNSDISDIDMVEQLLQFAFVRADTYKIAIELLDHFGDLPRLLKAETFELTDIRGISNTTAEKLTSLFKIIDRMTRITFEGPVPTGAVNHMCIQDFLCNYFVGIESEEVLLILLNSRMEIERTIHLGKGLQDLVKIDARNIIKYAIMNNSKTIAIAHNHPFGSFYPSYEDIIATFTIIKHITFYNITLNDHFIISGEKVFSFANSKLLDTLYTAFTTNKNLLQWTQVKDSTGKVYEVELPPPSIVKIGNNELENIREMDYEARSCEECIQEIREQDHHKDRLKYLNEFMQEMLNKNKNNK